MKRKRKKNKKTKFKIIETESEQTMFNDYKVIIPHDVYHQVMYWVNRAKTFEVSGFGTLVPDHVKKTFTVKQAILLKQDNTAGETEIDPVSLGKAMYDLRDAEGEIKWWWHSHHSMACFWSGTDVATIKQLGEQGYIVATVFNQKYEYKSALYAKAVTDFGESALYEPDLKTDIISFFPQTDFDTWETSYKALVTEKAFTMSSYFGGSGEFSRGGISEYDWQKKGHKGDYDTWKDPLYDVFSPYFKNDARFLWIKSGWYKQPGKVHEQYVSGHWTLKKEFKDQEDAIWNQKYDVMDAEEQTAVNARLENDKKLSKFMDDQQKELSDRLGDIRGKDEHGVLP